MAKALGQEECVNLLLEMRESEHNASGESDECDVQNIS